MRGVRGQGSSAWQDLSTLLRGITSYRGEKSGGESLTALKEASNSEPARTVARKNLGVTLFKSLRKQ